MNIYEYNSSTINYYSIENCGSLSLSMEAEDYGELDQNFSNKEDFYYIDCGETLTPFGVIKIKNNKTKYNNQSNILERYVNLNKKSIIFYGIIIRWIGSSILFELPNDLQRKVIPDVSGGGKL